MAEKESVGMSKYAILFFVTVVLILNMILLGIVGYFGKKAKDGASKVGFSLMSGVYLADILLIGGGLMLWV